MNGASAHQIYCIYATQTANYNLHKAKNAKKDEFYTQLGDIEMNSGTIVIILKIRWCIAIVMILGLAISSITSHIILKI